MAAVWYTGRSDSITISASDWASLGIAGASTVVWNKANGWSNPRSSFTTPQLNYLDSIGGFNTNATDGPRPGAAVSTPESPQLRRSDLDVLGISPSQLKKKFLAVPPHLTRNDTKLGPVSTDFTSVQVNVVPDAAFNRAYQMSNGTLPPVCDMGEGLDFTIANYQYAYGPVSSMPSSRRVLTDAPEVVFGLYAGTAPLGTWGFTVYIDGRPTQATPYTPSAVGAPALHKITMPNSNGRARLIEVRSAAFLTSIFVKKPYNVWKPPPRTGIKWLTIGDSYASNFGATNAMDAALWNIGPEIGVERFWLDFVGGTGFGVHGSTNGTDIPAGGPNRYIDRVKTLTVAPAGATPASRVWDIGAQGFDVVHFHGGFANDKYKGRTNTQCIDAGTEAISIVREKLPDAKIIVNEGFAPPTGFSTFNPDYIAIRQALQTNLASIGVYYIDIATTQPWINGTGFNNTGDATENSYLYIGPDGIHPDDEGHRYIRSRSAPKFRRILADDGSLVNTLI